MKKIFEPLKLEIYYYEEKDVVTASVEPPTDWEPGDNEGPMIPAGWFD